MVTSRGVEGVTKACLKIYTHLAAVYTLCRRSALGLVRMYNSVVLFFYQLLLNAEGSLPFNKSLPVAFVFGHLNLARTIPLCP